MKKQSCILVTTLLFTQSSFAFITDNLLHHQPVKTFSVPVNKKNGYTGMKNNLVSTLSQPDKNTMITGSIKVNVLVALHSTNRNNSLHFNNTQFICLADFNQVNSYELKG